LHTDAILLAIDITFREQGFKKFFMNFMMVTESDLLRDFARGISRILPLLLDLEQLINDVLSLKRLSDVNIGVPNEGEFWKFLHINPVWKG
jgi:hypothetical protein